jgi:hypothetical protein
VFCYVYDVPSFVLSSHVNNIPKQAHYLLTNQLHQEFFSMFPFSPKTMHDLMFLQGFLENQSFCTKTEIELVFVLIDEF